MAVTEPALPNPFESNLLKARNIVVEQVQAWMGTHAKHETIGHLGPVTQEFIITQGGMGPRSIVTVQGGSASRLGHGMSIQCVPTWAWYVVLRGVLSDRTSNALNFMGEAMRFLYADVFRDGDSAKIFSKPPVADSVSFQSRYLAKDEKTAYTVFGLQWLQEISLGAAGREREGDGVLLLINGTDEYSGDPNGDEVPFEVT
jgi:hypothetical protein